MSDRQPNGRFAKGNRVARLGGKARMAKLSDTEKSELAHLGLMGLANSRFGGSRKEAIDYLIQKGLAALDASMSPELRKWSDPDD